VTGWEKRVLLRHYLAQGLTKAVIAERLGISRRTINRWISKGDLDRDVDATVPRYGPRPAVPTKLNPFKPIIETRLKALPEISAVRLLDGDPGCRLHTAEGVRPEDPAL